MNGWGRLDGTVAMRRGSIGALCVVGALVVASCGSASTGGDATSTGAARAAALATAKPRMAVSAAASLQTAFTAYGKAFKRADVKFSFAGSDVLEAQIQAGLKPDVFAAANTSIPDRLYSVGKVEQPIRFASNELVLATRASNHKINSLADVAKKGVRLAIGSPTVPVGAYTRLVLMRVSPAESKAIFANVRSDEPDVTGIVGKLTQGAVDAGFVYKTDAEATHGELRVIHLPPSVVPAVTYGVAVVTGAPHPLQARLFVYGLLTGAGRKALLDAGFTAPTQ